MKNWSIQHRILIVSLVPAICIALFLLVYFSRVHLLDMERAEIEKATAVAIHLAPSSEFAVVTGNAELLAAISFSALADESFISISVTDENGRLLNAARRDRVHTTATWMHAIRSALTDTPLLSTIEVPIVRTTMNDAGSDEAVLTETADILGWVRIEVDLGVVVDLAFVDLRNSLMLTLLALIATAVLASWIAGSVANPIEALTDTVEQLRRGNLQRRANVGSGGELGRLEGGINAMAATIQASQHRLEVSISRATDELKTTLHELEQRNAELDNARRAAEQASDFKSQFLANMSHEIRTPINIILGFSELLSKSSREPLHREYVETIQGSAQSLLSLLNDILDLTRVESGQLSIESTAVDLNALLADIYNLFSPQAYSRGIEFLVRRAPAEQAMVVTDPLRLRQVLINLVNNAIKFTGHGHVLVSGDVEQASADQRWLKFVISDTGSGIPADAQANLFTAFSQGDMSTSRNFGGSGLGLHIASEIVMLMDGEIEFDSEVGRGSSFRVRLPYEPAPHHLAEHTGVDPLPAVLIDDYPPLARFYREFLDQAGITLAEQAAAGSDGVVLVNIAVDSFREGQLPRLPAEIKGTRWPLIACCPSHDPAMVRRLRHAGYRALIVKTNDPIKFRKDLDDALANVAAEDNPIVATDHHQHTGVRVMVVDDHAVNLKLMRRLGEHLGLSVFCEESALRAVEIARHEHFDLILMDVHMPEIDGLEAARRLREKRGANAGTPILALTADAYLSEEHMLSTGMNARLVKPVSLESFRDVVAHWVGERHQRHDTSAAPDASRELREALLHSLPQDRAALMTAIQDENTEQIRQSAHRIHGASLYCDVPDLLRAARNVESIATNGNEPQALTAAAKTLVGRIDELVAAATSGRTTKPAVGPALWAGTEPLE